MSSLLPAAFVLPRRQPAPIAAEPLLDQREADRLRVAGEWVDSMADWAESDLALEDAVQQGYVRGHADGLEAAVLCERIDWYAMGAISGVIGVWVVRSVLPVVIQGLDQLFGWLL